jgi:8-oxo-dGTP pyrophosphatase MutT (NUDIX family)
VFAVIVRGEYVLLVRARKRRRWQLPGGGLKRDETPHEGLLREVDEETGLAARILVRTGRYRRADGSLAIVFVAAVARDAEPAGPRYEIRRQRWVDHDEALRLLPRRVRRRLADALSASG